MLLITTEIRREMRDPMKKMKNVRNDRYRTLESSSVAPKINDLVIVTTQISCLDKKEEHSNKLYEHHTLEDTSMIQTIGKYVLTN